MKRAHQTSFPRAVLILLVLVSSMSMPAAAQVEAPDRVEARKKLEAARKAGDLEGMAGAAEDIAFAELFDYLDASYNLLLIQCRLGQKEKAFATVQTMLDAGFWEYKRLLGDKDLALINTGPRLKKMIRASWTERYISMLERGTRDAMQHPDQIMKTLAVKPGDVVADVGAGSGYFTVRLAAAVGEEGQVFATDIRQEMLDYIANRLNEGGIDNVKLLRVEANDPGLPAGKIDTVLMVDVIHYVKDRVAYAKKLLPALSPNGRVVVIDFRYDPDAKREFAPPLSQQVPRDTLDHEMAEAGFKVDQAYDFLPEQYFVIYRAAE